MRIFSRGVDVESGKEMDGAGAVDSLGEEGQEGSPWEVEFSERDLAKHNRHTSLTLLYTLNHSGWWSSFSACRATLVMKPKAC